MYIYIYHIFVIWCNSGCAFNVAKLKPLPLCGARLPPVEATDKVCLSNSKQLDLACKWNEWSKKTRRQRESYCRIPRELIAGKSTRGKLKEFPASFGVCVPILV